MAMANGREGVSEEDIGGIIQGPNLSRWCGNLSEA